MTRKRLLLLVLPVPVLLAAGMAWSHDSRLVAEKIATALAMPLGICWLLSIAICLLAWGRGDRRCSAPACC